MVSRLVWLCVSVGLASAAVVVPSRTVDDDINKISHEEEWWSTKQIEIQVQRVQRMLNDCAGGDPFTVCLKAKAVTFLDRVVRKDNIQLMDGLSLVADGNASRTARSGRALTEKELVASLPRDIGEKEQTLDDMIVSKLTEFFNIHTVKFDFPEGSSEVGEARKKEKKLLPYLIMAKLIAAGHLAMALKAIAAIAFKALIVAKAALAIAIMVALKKLLDKGHGEHKTYEVITTDHHDSHSHGHDRISFVPDNYAHDLAYRGYAGKNSK